MQKQACFNKAVRYFAVQERPCMTKAATENLSDQCHYRDGNGGMCVIGSFIPDGMYNKKIEAMGFDYLLKDHGDMLEFFREEYPGLLFESDDGVHLGSILQDVHDECELTKSGKYNRTALRKRLKLVAEDFGLKTDFLERTL